MSHYINKEFRDFADDIEGVNIHFLCTSGDSEADWQSDRVTRFVPLVEPGIRRLRLKLPDKIVAPENGLPTSRYKLLYYFEVFRGGDRHYSQIYTEMIAAGTKESFGAAPVAAVNVEEKE
jgi:hypothetical protein